jgi:tetratricopeptide (TPR) repeat protein
MQKYSEAEEALVVRALNSGENLEVIGGAAGHYWLGMVMERKARHKDAAIHYSKALELDPTLWSAFEKLCKLNPQVKPATLFKSTHPLIDSFNNTINERDYFNKIGEPLNESWLQFKQGKC